jgi:hypothetical protein
LANCKLAQVLSVILANRARPATLAHVTQSKALRGLGGRRRRGGGAQDLSAAAGKGHGRSQQRQPEVAETRGEGPGAEREREIVVEAATLVVCPMSVLTAWEAQAKQHTMHGAVRVTTLTTLTATHMSCAGTPFLVSHPGWAAGLGAGGGGGGVGVGGGAERGVAGNVGRGERREEEEGVVKLQGVRQEVVLVSYERLRSMHRKFLVLQNTSGALAATAAAAPDSAIGTVGQEPLPAATCKADGHAEDSVESSEDGTQEIVGGAEGGSVLTQGDAEAGEAGDGESWCREVEGGGASGDRGYEKSGSLSVVGGAKRGAGGQTKRVKAERKEEEALQAMFTGQWWRVVLDEAHVIKNRHSLSQLSWRLGFTHPLPVRCMWFPHA